MHHDLAMPCPLTHCVLLYFALRIWWCLAHSLAVSHFVLLLHSCCFMSCFVLLWHSHCFMCNTLHPYLLFISSYLFFSSAVFVFPFLFAPPVPNFNTSSLIFSTQAPNYTTPPTWSTQVLNISICTCDGGQQYEDTCVVIILLHQLNDMPLLHQLDNVLLLLCESCPCSLCPMSLPLWHMPCPIVALQQGGLQQPSTFSAVLETTRAQSGCEHSSVGSHQVCESCPCSLRPMALPLWHTPSPIMVLWL